MKTFLVCLGCTVMRNSALFWLPFILSGMQWNVKYRPVLRGILQCLRVLANPFGIALLNQQVDMSLDHVPLIWIVSQFVT